jgi:hypothetical protein
MISKSIIKVLGPESEPFVHNFIQNNEQFLKNIKLSTQLNTIGNYVYLVDEGNYSIINNIDAKTLFDDYEKLLLDFKKTYNTNNFVETNKIIWDGRVGNYGLYWVDVEKEYCVESMIRMQDCGRVNYGNTTLELREQTSNDNKSHMLVVYEKKSGNIKQIKGKQNMKPDKVYWVYLYFLLIESDYKFNQYVPSYKPENDLLISEFSNTLQFNIYSKHPNLNKLKKLT